MKKKSKGKAHVSRRAPASKKLASTKLTRKAAAAVSAVTAAIKGFNTIVVPPLATYWKGQGGLFAGIQRGGKGEPDHLLVAHFPKIKSDHAKALAFPASLAIDGHKDFESPTEKDGALCYATLKDQVEPGWYWLREQHPAGPLWARVQSFNDGLQLFYGKGYQNGVFVVRRIPIR